MNKAFYQTTVKRLPVKMIVNVAEQFIPIAALANSEALGVAYTLIRALMLSKDVVERLDKWALVTCYLQNGAMDSEDLHKYMEFKRLGYNLYIALKENKLYFYNRLFYKCEEVLDDGSLLLARVDFFEEFEQLSQI